MLESGCLGQATSQCTYCMHHYHRGMGFEALRPNTTCYTYIHWRSHRPATPGGRPGSSPKCKRNLLYIYIEFCNFIVKYFYLMRIARAPEIFCLRHCLYPPWSLCLLMLPLYYNWLFIWLLNLVQIYICAPMWRMRGRVGPSYSITVLAHWL